MIGYWWSKKRMWGTHIAKTCSQKRGKESTRITCIFSGTEMRQQLRHGIPLWWLWIAGTGSRRQQLSVIAWWGRICLLWWDERWIDLIAIPAVSRYLLGDGEPIIHRIALIRRHDAKNISVSIIPKEIRASCWKVVCEWIASAHETCSFETH